MQHLRAAIDATSLYGPRTGIGRFTAALLAELADMEGIDVVTFGVTWRGHRDLQSLVPTGVTATRTRMAAAPLRALWRRTDHPRIERWTGEVDVVHGPNYVVPPSRAPGVSSVHDLTFVHHPEFCTDDVLQYRGLLRRQIQRGAWIHTDSTFVRDEVIDILGADPERVVAVPLGVTLPASLDPARGQALAGSDSYVLALGTIEPRKNLSTLVAAFDRLAADLPHLRLVVAGPDGWGVAEYTDAVASAHHNDRIVRLGFVSEADRGGLLAGAGVVAVPSHYEGFGLTAAEAMLAGAPVVASDAGSHPEIVGDGGLLVGATDVDGLAEALRTVLVDAAVAEALSARGRRQASQYTWAATARGIVELWRHAIAEQVAE